MKRTALQINPRATPGKAERVLRQCIPDLEPPGEKSPSPVRIENLEALTSLIESLKARPGKLAVALRQINFDQLPLAEHAAARFAVGEAWVRLKLDAQYDEEARTLQMSGAAPPRCSKIVWAKLRELLCSGADHLVTERHLVWFARCSNESTQRRAALPLLHHFAKMLQPNLKLLLALRYVGLTELLHQTHAGACRAVKTEAREETRAELHGYLTSAYEHARPCIHADWYAALRVEADLVLRLTRRGASFALNKLKERNLEIVQTLARLIGHSSSPSMRRLLVQLVCDECRLFPGFYDDPTDLLRHCEDFPELHERIRLEARGWEERQLEFAGNTFVVLNW